jgi:hypothetical protein
MLKAKQLLFKIVVIDVYVAIQVITALNSFVLTFITVFDLTAHLL